MKNDSKPTQPVQEQPAQQEAPKYPIGGYALGDYWCVCRECKEWFYGDKRSFQCEPCATKMVQEAPIASEQREERVYSERIILNSFATEYNKFINSGGLIGSNDEWIDHSKLIPWFATFLNSLPCSASLSPSSTPLEKEEKRLEEISEEHALEVARIVFGGATTTEDGRNIALALTDGHDCEYPSGKQWIKIYRYLTQQGYKL